MRKGPLFLLVVVTFLMSVAVSAQSKKQRDLEEKRQAILSEIKQINTLLFKTRGEKKSVLAEVEDLDQKIAARENLIRITNQQANLLTREINDNLKKMEGLRTELEELKKDYSGMISKSYKSKSQQSRVMFLMSSENFLQAYKRLQYMKQYTKHRKKQGESIKSKSEELQTLNNGLIVQKKDKQKLIEENRKFRKLLAEEKKDQESLIITLKKDESKFAAQVRKKQREANEVDRQIEKLIKAAIAEANKKAGTTTRKVATAGAFALTPEAKALAKSFKSNKGKLIWPVEKGRVVNRYGTRQHPQFPNVTQKFSGVEIATAPNAQVRAIFKGEVIRIQKIKGANYGVLVRHGDYITIYQNLSAVSVKQGDTVDTKDILGTVFAHPTTNKSVLKFFVFQNDKKMNPADWIYKM